MGQAHLIELVQRDHHRPSCSFTTVKVGESCGVGGVPTDLAVVSSGNRLAGAHRSGANQRALHQKRTAIHTLRNILGSDLVRRSEQMFPAVWSIYNLKSV